jgi:hypothetical protein
MDIQGKINALENEKAILATQLETASIDERISIRNQITAINNQLTELYKHLPPQQAAGKFTFKR